MAVNTLLLLILPLIVQQVVLLIAALIDLTRNERQVRGGNKLIWALIIIFVSLFGPLLYFLIGREES
jgi:hypothetical protein